MHILFILAIIAGAIGIAGFAVAIVKNWPMVAACATPFIVTGALLTAAGATVVTDNYNEETNRICAEKGGVVTKDNHCFVDGKPVEFEPGVWQR